ncbi:putative response regulator receiver protein [Desulfovibrio ferrophilus]|uniref:Putative response regulator receiver protein n=1 Tax=Desulfovibrio ferrophilus TaxID=241368 RepID=A0A2Z6B255_9BACT|nr:putative response regulator receiver protein [Desulfovibrio ferrophilus]
MLNILIVDDSDSLRFILKAFFKNIGHCQEAVNGRQAVARVKAALDKGERFDVILMDIMMPELDGLDATKAIVALFEERDVPKQDRPKVIMLTCLNDPKHMIEAQYQCGACSYITKPFEREILFETFANLGLMPNPLDGEDDEG